MLQLLLSQHFIYDDKLSCFDCGKFQIPPIYDEVIKRQVLNLGLILILFNLAANTEQSGMYKVWESLPSKVFVTFTKSNRKIILEYCITQ